MVQRVTRKVNENFQLTDDIFVLKAFEFFLKKEEEEEEEEEINEDRLRTNLLRISGNYCCTLMLVYLCNSL